MSARIGWVGGGNTKRDLFPVMPSPLYKDAGSTFADPGTSYLAFDWSDIGSFPEAITGLGPGYAYPLGLNSVQMMFLFSRVRTWHVKFNGSYSVSVANDPPDAIHSHWEPGSSISCEFDYTIKVGGIWSFFIGDSGVVHAPFYVPSKERQVIQFRGYQDPAVNVNGGIFQILNFPPEASPDVGDITAPHDDLGTTVPVFQIDVRIDNFGLFARNLFWPAIYINFGGGGFPGLNGSTAGPNDRSFESFPFTRNIGAAQISDFPSLSLSAAASQDPTDIGTGQLQIDSATVTVTPKTYWAFADSNGDPVYDVNTGDVINSPFE